MHRRLGITTMIIAAALAWAGCATQDWVREEISKATIPLDSRVTKLETGAAQERAAREALDQRMIRFVSNRHNREMVERVQLRFVTGKYTILPEHEAAIQRVMKTLTDYTNYTADVVGYTDAVGSDVSNLNLSWLRAEAVRRYLVEKGPKVLHRMYFIGLGEDLTGGDKNNPVARADDRQVTITVFRPIE